MGKALVMKGVDFSTNKLATVSFRSTTPCTGLSISESAVTFTAIDATQQLHVTKTPANTTDELLFTSSDLDVATVSASGLVTCKGVGTAIITATCGEQTATVTVTSTITVSMSSYSYFNEHGVSGTDLNYNPPKDYVAIESNSRRRVYYSQVNELEGYPLFTSKDAAYDAAFPLALPHNTSKISISLTTGWTIVLVYCTSAREKYTYSLSSSYRQDAVRALSVDYATTTTVHDVEFDVPEGADSFVLTVGVASGHTPSEITDATTIVFS